MRITVAEYASSIGKTRATVHKWIRDRKAGRPSKLPSDVKVETIAGHFVINVKSKKNG